MGHSWIFNYYNSFHLDVNYGSKCWVLLKLVNLQLGHNWIFSYYYYHCYDHYI